MGKPYDRELDAIPSTLAWAQSADITALVRTIRGACAGPLVAVGSGGSLSTAHALVNAHRAVTGQVAAVLTPLDATSHVLDPDVAVWLLSASGNNVDVVAAARAFAVREPRQLVAFVGRSGSKVADVAAAHPYIDLHEFVPPTGKDGFLATNSLFGSAALLARAYSAAASGNTAEDPLRSGGLVSAADSTSDTVATWREQTLLTWTRDTTVVLHGGSTALGAIDLESKFTEAALGNVQLADYRNFGHGRHHWLAKRGEGSAVVALIADEDRDIAERTLALLPREITVARILLPGTPAESSLMSLLAAFRLTQWAGHVRGIDPGDPGVPPFGRQLYRLRPPRTKHAAGPAGLTARHAAAIQRKTRRTVAQLTASGDLPTWRASLRGFERALSSARFGAIVVDYDGTVVDTRDRFEPPRTDMAAELMRLLRHGVKVGVATGRGKSVRHALQQVLPAELWERVVIGYYNGAELGLLSDDATPASHVDPTAEIVRAAEQLRGHPDIAAHASVEVRAHQVTLTGDDSLSEQRMWTIAHEVTSGLDGVYSVARSSHSVDVLDSTASKLHVPEHLRAAGLDHPVLVIGDRGRWPGNDYQLLAQPFALSVDECSADPSTCWNLAPAGQRGTAATLHALRSLHAADQGTVVWR